MKNEELEAKIRGLLQNGMDSAALPWPALGRLTQSNFVRIKGLSRFWQSSDRSADMPLERCIEELVRGLTTHDWSFVIHGTPSSVTCWLGVLSEQNDALVAALKGALPGIQLDPDASLNFAQVTELSYAVRMSGIPTPRERNGQRAEQVEKICRGLRGQNWAYVVFAKPVEQELALKESNRIAQAIADHNAECFPKGEQASEPNPYARRVSELLSAARDKVHTGLTSGLWYCSAYLLTESEQARNGSLGLLRSAFSGDKSVPIPLRVNCCNKGVTIDDVKRKNSVNPTGPEFWLNTHDLAVFACPPQEEYPGYEVVEDVRFSVSPGRAGSAPENAIHIGEVLDRGASSNSTVNLTLTDLTRHALVCGVTGSGKTSTCVSLLEQAIDAGVPFLVIEPAKSEYRSLLLHPRFKGKLRVFTAGNETISPLRLNPFEVPKGILVQSHIDYLISLFSAAFVLYPPMPYVLQRSLHEVYEERGWNLSSNVNSRGTHPTRMFPTLSELIEKTHQVVDSLHYDEQLTKDLKAGLVARLEHLRAGGGKGDMLDTQEPLDVDTLFKDWCVLELKQLVSDDEKAFVMGLLLIRLYEYHESRYGHGAPADGVAPGGLRHITLIEEAHRLLRNVSTEQGSEVVANPKGRALEMFTNILAEIRSYGEGLVIAEQIPAKLTPDAMKNTNLKIIHRLMAEDDRRSVGMALNLTPAQSGFLVRLKPGEAVVYTEGMTSAAHVLVPFSAEMKHLRPLSDKELSELTCASDPVDAPRRAVLPLEDDWNVVLRRLFNSLRREPLNPDIIRVELSNFVRLCRREPARHSDQSYPLRMLLLMINAEIERRGKFYWWSHAEVEALSDEANRAANALLPSLDTAESEDAVNQRIAALIEPFRAMAARLHTPEKIALPFAGCTVCMHPCHFRFDMAYSPENHFSTAFQERIENADLHDWRTLDEAARVSERASQMRYSLSDVEMLWGATVCFAAQQVAAIGGQLPDDVQIHLVTGISKCLNASIEAGLSDADIEALSPADAPAPPALDIKEPESGETT